MHQKGSELSPQETSLRLVSLALAMEGEYNRLQAMHEALLQLLRAVQQISDLKREQAAELRNIAQAMSLQGDASSTRESP